MSLLLLPNELLLHIADHVPFVALINLGASCTHLMTVLNPKISAQRDTLKYQYHSVFSGTYKPFPYHRLLLLILRQELPAMYIQVLDTDDSCGTEPWISDSEPPPPPSVVLQIRPADKRLLQTTTLTSPWLDPGDSEQIFDQLWRGYDDAALCVLVPMLTNLRTFTAPPDAPRLEEVFTRIAKAYYTALDSNTEPAGLPFRSLRIVSTRAGNGVVGIGLEGAACYSSIPSVRRLIMQCSRSQRFAGWPSGLRSRVSEVYLCDSTVSAGAICGFAEGIEGPCIIRMNYDDYGGDFPSDDGLVWDHYVIASEEGTRRERLQLKYDEDVHEPGFARNSPESDCSVGMNRMRHECGLYDLE